MDAVQSAKRVRKVIVIGSGPAGLAAAYTLRKRGVEATILEASDHAGGRMAGEVVDGFFISTGAEFFDRSYHTALGLARELGLPTHTLRMSGAMVQHVKGAGFRRVTFANTFLMRLYSPKALWQVAKIMLKLGRRRKDLAAADYAGLLDFDTPGESFADFALRHGGPESVEQVCDPMCVSVLLVGPDQIGTLFGIKRLWKALGVPFAAFQNPLQGVGRFSAALGEACADFTLLSSPVESVVVENVVVCGAVVGGGGTTICTRRMRSSVPHQRGPRCESSPASLPTCVNSWARSPTPARAM